MNPEAEEMYRNIKFQLAKQTLKRLLDGEEISESEYQSGLKLLADKFGIDILTGFARSAESIEHAEKEARAERYHTYINLTESLKKEAASPATIIITWLRSHKTLYFLRQWETANNPKFNDAGFNELMASGKKTITPKIWCEKTNAIGIMSRQGHKGGIYAHRVIATDFYMWHNPQLRYYLIDTLVKGKLVDEHGKNKPQLSWRKVYKLPIQKEK